MKFIIRLAGVKHGLVVEVPEALQERLTVLDRLIEEGAGHASVALTNDSWYAAEGPDDLCGWRLSRGEEEHRRVAPPLVRSVRWDVRGTGVLWLSYVTAQGHTRYVACGTFVELEAMRRQHDAAEAARRASKPIRHVFRHPCRRCAWALYLEWCAETFGEEGDGLYDVKVGVTTELFTEAEEATPETVVTVEVTRRPE